MKGVTQLRGDFGNPKGTGLAKITINNLESLDAATGLTDMDTFVDSLKTGGFTACNVGDTGVTVYALQLPVAPGSDVNVDSQLVVIFRNKDEQEYRRLTIPGVDPDSAVLESATEGRRLTAAAKTTLEGYINTLFGWTAKAVVITGKHLIKS